jgi:cytochrome b561
MTRNTHAEWGWPAKLLHWIAALSVLVLLLHGWWMVHMTPQPERFVNYAWHAAIGYDLLVLSVLRLLWRWMNPVPAMPDNLQRWEVLAARAGHIGVYILLFGASLTGWALAGTFRRPLAQDLFGIPIPQLLSGPGPDRIYPRPVRRSPHDPVVSTCSAAGRPHRWIAQTPFHQAK